MRLIRGTILTIAFVIENEMIMLDLAYRFGANDSVSDAYITAEDQWLRDHTLARKIEAAKLIFRCLRTQEEADRIIQKLTDFRELRNLMAHYPCWLDPQNDPSTNKTIDFTLFIGDAKHEWEIDVAQLQEWQDLLDSLLATLQALRASIVGPDSVVPYVMEIAGRPIQVFSTSARDARAVRVDTTAPTKSTE